MSKFRIGDEVLCISPPDGNDDLIGETGIIIDIGANELPYCVEWYNAEQLGWWCEEESLVLLEEEN